MNLHGPITHVLREHIEQAAFQWAQGTMLAGADRPDQAAIAQVKARLWANLDAILIAGQAAWPIISACYKDYPEEGEMFVAAYIAIAFNDTKRVEQCAWMTHQAPEVRFGLAGALQQVAPSVSAPTVRWMLQTDSAVIRAVALEVLAHHRADAGEVLRASLADGSPILKAAACKLAAATARHDCASLIANLTAADDPELRFAAATALLALGHETGPAALKAEVEGGSHPLKALRLLQKTLPAADFLAYSGALYQREESRALAVRALGMTGDRGHLAWLIQHMSDPRTILAAGESFLELFPEASTVEGLFSMEERMFPQPISLILEQASQPLPVAESIKRWADIK